MQEYIDISAKGNILDVLTKLQSSFQEIQKDFEDVKKTATETLGDVNKKMSSVSFASFHQNLQNVNQGLQDMNAPGLQYNSTLADLSALTSIAGSQLDELGAKAKASAGEFGGTAGESINNYKVLLSRLGPGIAENSEALNTMERDVRILSKTMSNDAPGAVDALTTAALQFGVDLSNPTTAAGEMTRMMDVMANSAQLGAAEVPQISAALKVSGVAAKQANVSFIETNAALQALAAGGKEGSEAGMGLRNVLSKIAGEDIIPKEAADKLRQLGVDMDIVSDTSLPFTTRLRELKKAQGDATIMAQVFGVENAASANILLDSVDAQDKMALSIGKVGGAQAQANIVMESATEKLARMQASIDNAKIAFFEATGGATAYLGPIAQIATTVSAFIPIYSASRTAVLALATAKGREALMENSSTAAKIIGQAATKTATAATWLWNAALAANPIGLVIAGAAVLVGGLYLLSEAFDDTTAAEKVNADVSDRVSKSTINQRVEVELLFDKLKSAKRGTDEYNDALAQLNSKYPNILKKYDLHKGKIEDINRAEKELISNISKRAEADAWAEILKEEKRKEIQLKQERADRRKEGKVLVGSMHAYSEYGREYALKGDELNESREKQKTAAEALAKLNKSNPSPKKETEKNSNSKDYETENKKSAQSPTNSILSNTSSSKSSMGSSSSSGVGEVKRVDVRIENLVKEITIQTSNMRESAAEIKQMVTEALVGAVRDFEVGI